MMSKTEGDVVGLLTVGRARSLLAKLWVFSLLPLVVFVIAQIVVGRFGSDWQTPWSWMSSLIFPIWGIIFAVVTVGSPRIHAHPVHSKFTFHIAIALSTAYIVVLYIIALLGPLSPFGIKSVMASSGIFMGVFQTTLTAILGKFFLEALEEAA